ncbi:MAG: diguanylate cyclase [Dehalococcoidia bacterium]|nr:diguanylate cyclase [Dehalococcoidia bacterium]
MTAYSLIPLVAVIAYVPLMIIMITSRPWKKQNWYFVLYLIAAMVWSSVSFLLHSSFLIEYQLLLAKLNICTFLWMAMQLYLFSRSFGYGPYSIQLAIGYCLLAGSIVLAVLGYIPQSVKVDNGVSISLGLWLVVLFVPLVLLMADNVIAQVRKLRGLTDQVQRTRVTYILLGVCIMALFSLSNGSEALSRFPIDHFGNLIAACLWTYATVRHQIVDIRFIARRGLSWGALIVVAAIVGLLLYWAVSTASQIEERTIVTIFAMLIAFVMGIIIFQLRDIFINLVDRLFLRDSYQYRRRLNDFITHGIAGVFRFRDLCAGLLPLIVGGLRCQQAYLLVPATASNDFIIEFAEPKAEEVSVLRIRHDSPIITWLKREYRYLTHDRLDILPEFRGLLGDERDRLTEMGIELFFPIISRGSLIGILLLARRQSGRYALEDIDLVQRITKQISGTMEKEYLQEQLRRREQELVIINRLDRLITSSLNTPEVFGAFIDELRSAVDVDWGSIILIEKDQARILASSTRVDMTWQEGETIQIKNTTIEWVANHKTPLVESDLIKSSKFLTDARFIQAGMRSIVYLPLPVKGEIFGCLIVASCQPAAYSPEQINLLESLAFQIAVSVENSDLYTKAEQRARIDELTRLFNRRHFDESLAREIAVQFRNAGVLSVIFLDLDRFKEHNDIYGHPDGDRVLARVGSIIEKSIRNVDMAFRYGGDEFAIILPGAEGKDAFGVAERVRTMIANAMEEENSKVTASLGLASWPSDGVTADEITTAADRALYYAKRTDGDRTCVVSEMLSQQTEQGSQETRTEKESLNTIYALAHTIEARDQYTYGHSRNVSRYAVALAEALELPSEKVAVIGTAALLHDIGKIGIPDEVLNKADNLTDKEWEQIRTHSKLSAAIVGHVISLTPCLPGILHHHERWDGQGYPSGLRGEAIPLEARILSVADAFEAMTSPRSYREAMSFEEALEEIKLNAGKQFDPKVVDAFIPIALPMVADRRRKENI